MNADGTPIAVAKRRSAAVNYLEVKDESDITREIRSWVLNKGVGESVLHKAARLGYIDVIVYCLERLDMHPDQKDNAGYTPLHEACSRGRVDIARALLQYGANHSETAHSGIRPLHEAVDNGFVEIVRLLLSFGADPLLATYAGMSSVLAQCDSKTKTKKSHIIRFICRSNTDYVGRRRRGNGCFAQKSFVRCAKHRTNKNAVEIQRFLGNFR